MKRAVWIVPALAAVAVLVWFVMSRDTTPQVPIEARAANGTGALVLLLEGYGFDVQSTATLPEPDAGTLIVIARGTGVSDGELQQFADRGGRVLLVGREAGLPTADVDVVAGRGESLAQGSCTIPDLADTTRITSSQDALDVTLTEAASVCFADGDSARVSQIALGRGLITWIGDVGLVQNENIADEENAELFVRLLGDAETVIFADARMTAETPPPESAPEDVEPSETPELFNLLPSWARLGLWQLVVALVLFIWWRSRRLGDPVVEDLPVEVPASEFVRASGRVMQRSRARSMSLAYIRRSFREDCGRWLGLSADAPADEWVRVVAGKTNEKPGAIRLLLYGAKPANEAELVDYTKKIDSLREECMR
ncbi:MAG: DUF4350 domain-containing protein [Acidimicrobiales bacterium]